jgi:hypothetical protein
MARSSSAFRRWGPAAGRRPRALARPGNERVQGSARAVVRRALSPLAPRGWWWLGGGGCVRIAVGQTMRTTHADALASRVRNRCPEPSAWRRPPEGRGTQPCFAVCAPRWSGRVSGWRAGRGTARIPSGVDPRGPRRRGRARRPRPNGPDGVRASGPHPSPRRRRDHNRPCRAITRPTRGEGSPARAKRSQRVTHSRAIRPLTFFNDGLTKPRSPQPAAAADGGSSQAVATTSHIDVARSASRTDPSTLAQVVRIVRRTVPRSQ